MSLALRDLLYLTCRSLASNPLRSVLTATGIFMGVAAVTATLQVGTISRAVIAKRLAEREAPQVTIYPDWSPNPSDRADLRLEDIDYLRQRLAGLEAISATRWWFSSTPVLFQDRQADPNRIAVSQDYLLTTGNPLLEGRFFTPADFTNYRPVAVIDQVLAAQLFADQSPIGQLIYASRQPYTIVGVVQTQPNQEEEQPQGELYVTIATYSALTGRQNISGLRLRPQRLDELEDLGLRAEQLLTQRFPGRTFYVENNVADLLEQEKILMLASSALATVGVISLLVGGVGIANIMIASVTERTAEIGLRRAIGATQQEIMVQFILEATLLSLLGGTIAIASVHGLTLIVTDVFELPYQFDSQTAMLALGSALTVGVGASFLPALRASQLDPVKALRSE